MALKNGGLSGLAPKEFDRPDKNSDTEKNLKKARP
jgi:hypothetical protein